MSILTVNAGSSSLRLRVVDREGEIVADSSLGGTHGG